MAYIRLHGEECVFLGTPSQFSVFLKNYGRRLAWGAPSPAYVPMNVPPVFFQVLANGPSVLADTSEPIGKDELEASFEYEVLYPIYNGSGIWERAKGFIRVVSLPRGKSLLIVWTSLDRHHESERKYVLEVWEHLKVELEKLQLIQSPTLTVKDELNQNPLDSLRTLMSNVFSLRDIQDICFSLGVDYENLAGSTKNEKIRELILLSERTGTLKNLTSQCQKERPFITWPDSW